MKTTLGKPRPVRLDKEADAELKRLAVSNGATVGYLIRLAVRVALPAWEREGIKLTAAR